MQTEASYRGERTLYTIFRLTTVVTDWIERFDLACLCRYKALASRIAHIWILTTECFTGKSKARHDMQKSVMLSRQAFIHAIKGQARDKLPG